MHTPAITTALSSLKPALRLTAGPPFTASGRKTAEGLCALSHQAMREEVVCVHALVRGLAEIRVNKQHIVTHTHTPDSDPPRLR